MRIFASDLDGTLLKSNSIIDDSILDAIKLLNSNDYRLIAVSGRVSSSVRHITNNLGLSDYIIANNGAVILDKEDNIIKSWPLSKTAILKVIDIANIYDIDIRLYSKDTYHSEKLDTNQIKHLYTKDNRYSVDLNIVRDLKSFIEKTDIKFYKILLDSRQNNYQDFYREVSLIDELELTNSGKINLDIMEKDVSKANALDYLIDYLRRQNENIEQIIAIGDYNNDIDMIKRADIGIAMGNSVEDLIKTADIITDTNDNNGFRKAIEKVFEMNNN